MNSPISEVPPSFNESTTSDDQVDDLPF
jgi:hypothetical protein